MNSYDTIVVGGGITGLGCAEMLHRAGRSVLVLEAQERVGGCLRTDIEQGMVLDRGPQTIRSADPELFAQLASHGLDGERIVVGTSGARRYLVHGGRAVPLPEGLLAALTTPLFSRRAKLRVLREPWVARGVGTDETVASFFGRRLGSEVRDGVVDAVIGGIHAGDPDALSMNAVLPGLLRGERTHGSLVRAALAEVRTRRAARRRGDAPRRAEIFGFRGGLEAWPAALARHLGEQRVRTGARAADVRRELVGWAVEWREGGVTREARALHVVLAAPAPESANLLDRLAPAAARALRDIPYAPVALVHLAYPRGEVSHPLDGFGILAPRRENTGILGIVWCSSLYPGRAPRGTVVTATFVGGMRDAALAHASDAELVRAAHRQHSLLLGASIEPRLRAVQRWPQAIPQAEVGHAERIGVVELIESRLPGLHVTGSFRNGASVPACWTEGRRVAMRILAGSAERREAAAVGER